MTTEGKNYFSFEWGRCVVEVACPLCSEIVDLGSNSKGIYECPYCRGEFEYEPEITLTTPVIIGKEIYHSQTKEVLKNVFEYIVLTLLTAGLLSLFKFFEDRSGKKWLMEKQADYAEGILDPSFLSGSGLKVYPNLDAELLPRFFGRPVHKFASDEITGLVYFHTTGASRLAELHILSDKKYVATLHVGHGGLAKRKAQKYGEQICALYGFELGVASEHVSNDS